MSRGNGGGYITRQEHAQQLAQMEERIGAQLSNLSSKFDARVAAARSVWIAAGSLFLTLVAMGGALVGFSLHSATAPLSVRIDAASESRAAQDRLHSTQLEALEREYDARYAILERLVLEDASIRHGDADVAAVVEAVSRRQTELWQLIETADLKVQRISERLAVLETKE